MGGNGCPEDESKAEYRYPILPAENTAIELDPSICFQKSASYKVKIDFRTNDGVGDGSTLIDSVSFSCCIIS